MELEDRSMDPWGQKDERLKGAIAFTAWRGLRPDIGMGENK